MKRLVIVGGGFGGLLAAKTLASRKDLAVTLIDKKNHHLFQPLLYQVAMAGLSPADIATPLRGLLARAKNVRVLMDEVTGIHPDEKRVETKGLEDLHYDYLLLACGARHSYFGHDEWEEPAPGLKTLEHATEVRRRVLTAFEMAEKEPDKNKQNDWLTFVVVGGGPTGVELAGALGEITRFTLSRDFRNIDPRRARIFLIEGGPRVLATFPEVLSRKAARALENLGVAVWTHKIVTRIDADGVLIGNETLGAKTVLWAAGVQPAPLTAKLPFEKDKSGRILVNEDLSVPGRPEIFVIGDQAHYPHMKKGSFAGKPLPGVAPVAMQEGKHAAKNILADLAGKKRKTFVYTDHGNLATIGRASAVVHMGPIHLSGFPAWIFWLFVHILFLIGFKNRVVVFVQWAWSFITYSRGARIITSREWK
ncbi:MAG: NAD(P)/FAD-dependent oxidoreductase, partial [Spirochaetia bacterium]|nr:NAD(P)/FAD-dependent oxidoreductase [Spirochaetia bacterium]